MELTRAIALANELRPNTLSDEVKVGYIFELEADFAEMMKKPIPENTWPREDVKLLMPFPHDTTYVLYLCAKIDYAQEDTALYMNDKAVANNAISQARAWWRRNNMPHEFKRIKV